MTDWNAGRYHDISSPQQAWGRRVLDRLPLAGTERVLDIGCGTGRLTARDRRTATCRLRRRRRSVRGDAGDGRSVAAGSVAADVAGTRGRAPRCRSAARSTRSSAARRSTGSTITRRCSARSSRRCARADGWWRSAAAGPTSRPSMGAATRLMRRAALRAVFRGVDGADLLRRRGNDKAASHSGGVRERRRLARGGVDAVRWPGTVPGFHRQRLPAAPRRAAAKRRAAVLSRAI